MGRTNEVDVERGIGRSGRIRSEIDQKTLRQFPKPFAKSQTGNGYSRNIDATFLFSYFPRCTPSKTPPFPTRNVLMTMRWKAPEPISRLVLGSDCDAQIVASPFSATVRCSEWSF